ncbi:hypothetical protein D915_010623 [Fasciola hepatica]|uniref:Uncharacterized protein n=1 Tax=Fasciola hepatica TaxID=6192 RepID=A0A4E0QUN6_FASHE|nr:hypothetical protein D915_010623 [Fasciola hepatica]
MFRHKVIQSFVNLFKSRTCYLLSYSNHPVYRFQLKRKTIFHLCQFFVYLHSRPRKFTFQCLLEQLPSTKTENKTSDQTQSYTIWCSFVWHILQKIYSSIGKVQNCRIFIHKSTQTFDTASVPCIKQYTSYQKEDAHFQNN